MTQIHNQKGTARERLIAYLIGLSVLVISLLLLCAWLFDGFAASRYEFIEFYSCQGSENSERIAIYSAPAKRIYICGEIEANGIVTGSIDIYFDGEMIHHEGFSQRAGRFIHEVRYRKGFQPGEYTINFYAQKRVRAQTTFTVTSASPP